ncbi:MAG: YfcE family phosphodiesterase [Treponema sp.]|uniref:YfcE family phosphodiesterase n=1 Tax=Treponema sp. TaxID=166 RepID=UPI00298E90BD|nr:YfcE family phosphodiesterase [Treponema sp.]MBR5934051.1 YfcE family phosphodiesterase [Treponema sp.]
MNLIVQAKNFLLGSKEDIDSLSEKENVSILAVSDTHGNSSILKKIIENFPDKDLFAFLGDGISDVVSLLESLKKNKKLLKIFPPVAAIVCGNGDDDSYPVTFNPSEEKKSKNDYEIKIPKILNLRAAKTNVLLTHGHVFGVYYGMSGIEQQASIDRADLVLYGHTHIAARSNSASTTFINPGSCTLPRRGLPPSFALINIFSGLKKIECTFFKIKISLTEGISFIPFSPAVQNW